MKNKPLLSVYNKYTVAGLLIATGGVIIQILSGAPYPTIPPVFFILLVPAALIAFSHLRWAPAIAVLAGLFLTFGLFASGASTRLIHLNKLGDSIGLWIQTLAVVLACVAGILAIVQNYRIKTSLKTKK
jgi:NhaP-type Na+/H+ or K+/H+ antiporter